MAPEFITPTKDRPVFRAVCTYFGYIENRRYKRWEVPSDNGTLCGDTFAVSYEDAISMLHEWIKENRSVLVDYPKASFELYVFYGKLDKYGESIIEKVYSISAKKAKKFLF